MTKYLHNFKRKLKIREAEDLQQAEILTERRHRFLLVIKARWAIMLSYMIYGFIAGVWIFLRHQPSTAAHHLITYASGFIVLTVYNGFLHYSYERLSGFKGLAQAQMIADVLIATVIIHFTGGVASWFWSVYLLVILQSAFLFDRKIETMEIALLCGLSFGLLTILEHFGVIYVYVLPFVTENHTGASSYEILKVFWVLASSIAVAVIASYLLGIIRQKEKFLANKSITDGLTGLYNHSYFHKRLNSELERAKRYKRSLSLILMDLDDFKNYNDTYGHQAGDKLLSAVAAIFNQNVRSNDVDTVYRYGGDEFAIIAPETSSEEQPFKPAGAISLAERVRNKVKEQLVITISMGISSFPQHANETSNLFNAADFALYKAKERGKDCVVNSSRKLIIEKLKTGGVKN